MTRFRFAARGVVAVAVTLAGGSLAQAQPGRYAPSYQPAPGQYQQAAVYPQTAPYSAAQPTAQQPVTQPPATQQQQTFGSYQLPNYQAPQATAQQAPAQTAQQYQIPQYQAAGQYQAPTPGARYSVAQNETVAPESVPATTAPAPGQSYPAATSYPGSDCGCNTGAPAANSWEGYMQAPAATAGCDVGYNGGYNGCAAGDCNYGTFGGGGGQLLGGNLAGAGAGRQWFFGAYGLYMGRDRPGYEKIAVLVDTPAAYPYYPTQDQTYVSTGNVDPDFQWGAEIRFGSTFGRSCDPCGPRPYAWEVTYWGLSEDEQSFVGLDALADTDRIYGSLNYAGLEFDRDGAAGGTYAARDMNEYTDYQMPIDDPATNPNAVRVVGVRVRNNFQAQNLEINLIRFPVAGCDPCSRFSMNTSAGIRFFEMDEFLQVAYQFSDPLVGTDGDYTGGFPSSDDNNLFDDVDVDNELAGFQIGSSMNWLIGSKWSAFCDTQLGIYGNQISKRHRVWSGLGEVTFANGGDFADIRSSKTDVSFLGEARLGAGYQVGCNCRLTAAYRVMAITGVALAGEQLPNNWSSPEYVNVIDSNDSMVLHGLQTGVEWKY